MGDEAVDWVALVPHLVHPTKVIVLEAFLRIGLPLSATQLERVSGGKHDVGSFSHHLKHLAKLGVLEVVGKRKTRKSRSSNKETFFYFASAVKDRKDS